MRSLRTDLLVWSAAAAAWVGVWTETGPLLATLGGAWPLPAWLLVALLVALLHGSLAGVAAVLVRLDSREVAVGLGTLISAWTTLLLHGFLGGAAADRLTALAALVFAAVAAALVRGRSRPAAVALFLLAPGALAASWLWTTRDGAAGTGPSVLLITVEGARADRYGSPAIDTPAYDQLADGGTSWTRAIAASVRPVEAVHGVLGVGRRSGASLPAELSAAGLHTGAFVSSQTLAGPGAPRGGFDLYDDDLRWVRGLQRTSPGRLLEWVQAPPAERRADDTVDRALTWIGSVDGPWFAWVHLVDPTGPYEPPPPWDERYTRGLDGRNPHATGMPDARALTPAQRQALQGVTDPHWVVGRYEGEIGFAEQQTARLVDAVPDGTVVLLVGLFGESLGEDGLWFRHDHLGAGALEVPAVLRGPGVPSEVRTRPVSVAEVPGWVRAARRRSAPPPPWLPARAELRTEAGCRARERLSVGWRDVECAQP